MQARLGMLDENQIFAYLGAGSQEARDELMPRVIAAWDKLCRAVAPRLTYRVIKKDSPELLPLMVCRDIEELLSGCRCAVLFAVTLGAEADRLILKSSASDMSEAVLLDACAAYATESICDNFCSDFEAEGRKITRRFSPGYGDVPLDIQGYFASLLELYRRIGVSVTEGGIMTPQKTVTAIFGITEGQVPDERACGGCSLFDNCNLRKEGLSCGK